MDKILLWLDDTRDPEHHAPKWDGDIVWVKSVDQFDEYMRNNPMPEMISFDYMLGRGEDMFQDGIGAAKSVIRKCTNEGVNWPRWRIHSTFDTVHKLRHYIEYAIHMYDLGDAVEEDRQPNTPEQDEAEGTKEQVTKQDKPIKLGRNEKCHCQSGKKFKHCHGK